MVVTMGTLPQAFVTAVQYARVEVLLLVVHQELTVPVPKCLQRTAVFALITDEVHKLYSAEDISPGSQIS